MSAQTPTNRPSVVESRGHVRREDPPWDESCEEPVSDGDLEVTARRRKSASGEARRQMVAR